MDKHDLIKLGILTTLLCYPILELTRLIIICPNWMKYDVRPVFEIVFMWICFIAALWLSNKTIKFRSI